MAPSGQVFMCGTVVGRVHDEGVVRDARARRASEDCADVLVMVDHAVVIGALPAARLPMFFSA